MIKLGDSAASFRVGDAVVPKIYHGDELVWAKNLLTFDLTDPQNVSIIDYHGYTKTTLSDGVIHISGYQSDVNVDTSAGVHSNDYISLPSNTDVYLSFDCFYSNTVLDIYFASNSELVLQDANGNRLLISKTYYATRDTWNRVELKYSTTDSTQYKLKCVIDRPNIYGVGSYVEMKNFMISTEPNAPYSLPSTI